MSAGPSHRYNARPLLQRAATDRKQITDEDSDDNSDKKGKGKEKEVEINYLDPGQIEEIFDPNAPGVPAFSEGNPTVARNILRQLAIDYQRNHKHIKDKLIEFDRQRWDRFTLHHNSPEADRARLEAEMLRIAQDNFFPLEMQVQQENIEMALRWEWEQRFDAEGVSEADRKPFWKIFRERIIEPNKMVPEATLANEPTDNWPYYDDSPYITGKERLVGNQVRNRFSRARRAMTLLLKPEISPEQVGSDTSFRRPGEEFIAYQTRAQKHTQKMKYENSKHRSRMDPRHRTYDPTYTAIWRNNEAIRRFKNAQLRRATLQFRRKYDEADGRECKSPEPHDSGDENNCYHKTPFIYDGTGRKGMEAMRAANIMRKKTDRGNMFAEEKPHRGNTVPLTSNCHHCSYHHLICDLLNRQTWPCTNCEERGLWCVNSGWDTETEEIDNIPYVEPDFYIGFLNSIQDDPQLWYEQNFRRKNVLGPDGSIINPLGRPNPPPSNNANNVTESLAKEVANSTAAPVEGIAPFAVAPAPQAAGVFGFPNFNGDIVNVAREKANGTDDFINRGLGGILEVDRAQQEMENNFSSWNMNLTLRPKGERSGFSPKPYNPIDDEIVLPDIDLDSWEALEAATRWPSAEEELQPYISEIDPRLLSETKPLPPFVSLDTDPSGSMIPQTTFIKILDLVPVNRSDDSWPSGADLGFNDTGCNEKIGYLVGPSTRNPERDATVCATKPAKRCDHLRHRSGHYYICTSCRRKQTEIMGGHQGQAIEKARTRLCGSCVKKLISVPESRRYRNQCLCASQLNNSWFCHWHRQQSIKTSNDEAERMKGVVISKGFSGICLGCFVNPAPVMSRGWGCIVCREWVLSLREI